MDWYTSYRLVEDGDGYTLEINLNKDMPEFAEEFLSNAKVNALKLEDQAKKLIQEKFSGMKINAVKFLVGAIAVATIPLYAGTFTASAAPANATHTVTASRLNVRAGPSTSNTIIHALWNGNQVPVIGESGNWYQIRLSDGRTGWVSKTYLRVNQPGGGNQQSGTQQKVDKVVATAKSLLGTPYVYGGESPQEGGFDCSGLTQYAYKQAGYTLNRISADQAKQGTAVAWNSMKPGDLVFFSFNMNNKIDHVGIYIGNGQMIHSPRTGDVVKTTNINVSYWQQRFVTAKRIFT